MATFTIKHTQNTQNPNRRLLHIHRTCTIIGNTIQALLLRHVGSKWWRPFLKAIDDGISLVKLTAFTENGGNSLFQTLDVT